MDFQTIWQIADALAKIGLAATPFAAAWFARETYKINRQRRELEAYDREEIGAEFVQAEVLDFYRNIVRDIRLNGISGLNEGTISGLQQRLLHTDEIVRSFARSSDQNAKIWRHWTKFRFNFEEFLRAVLPRQNANPTVKDFKKNSLDPHIIRVIRAIDPTSEPDEIEEGIRNSTIEPAGKMDIIEVGFSNEAKPTTLRSRWMKR